MTDLPAIDLYVNYVATGGEAQLPLDWSVSTPNSLTVRRTRAAATVTLVHGIDYFVTGLNDDRGATVRLTPAALAADVYEVIGDISIVDPGDAAVYVLARWNDQGWSVDRLIKKGDALSHDAGTYLAIVTHKTSAATEPGTGAQWQQVWHLVAGTTGVNPVLLVGVNATADAAARLSVSSPSTLLSHEGAGHVLKVNKASAPATASLLLQDALSGRAEIGLTGDDNLHVKVSADGATWFEAILVNRTNGALRLLAGTVAAPSLALGDTDTGFYSPAAGKLGASLDGTRALLLDKALNTTGLGSEAGVALTTGVDNTAIGTRAMASATTAYGNVMIGFEAGFAMTVSTPQDGTVGTASYNVGAGWRALYSNTTGYENMAFGNLALFANTTGYLNTAVGSEVMRFNTTGQSNAAFGVSALAGNTTGSGNVGIGYNAGGGPGDANRHTTGGSCTYLGGGTIPASMTPRNNMTLIGAGTTGDRDNTLYLGRLNDSVIIGGATVTGTAGLSIAASGNPRAHLRFEGSNAPSSPADGEFWYAGSELYFRTGTETKPLNGIRYKSSTLSWFVGFSAGNTTHTGSANSGMGNNALDSLTSGNYNIAQGDSALTAVANGNGNVGIGYGAGSSIVGGSYNTCLGYLAGSLIAGGIDNVVIGRSMGAALTSGGQNVLIGRDSGNAVASASGNVVVGYNSAKTMTGVDSVVIGNTNAAGVTSGAYNVVIGAYNGGFGGTSERNVVIGVGHTTPGNKNTIIGGAVTTTGDRNVVLADHDGNLFYHNKATTVAALPSASSTLTGARRMVSDSTAAASGNFGATLTGGGANVVPVYCDGTNWRIG